MKPRLQMGRYPQLVRFKAGEWWLIFGRYINVKEGEGEARCYLKQTPRNYDDETWEQESRRMKGEKLKETKK
jgi:hypothetical protein